MAAALRGLASFFSVALNASSDSSASASRNLLIWDFCFAMSDVFDEFHKWVGVSITGWAHAEDYLFMICQTCLGVRHELASIVYYRTPQLDSRLKLVDELLVAILPSKKRKNGGHLHPDLTQWVSIKKELENLLTVRRRIAHHPMRANLDTEVPGGFRIHIETSFAEWLRGRSENSLLLRQSDLIAHVMKLQTTVRDLKKFHSETLPKHIE